MFVEAASGLKTAIDLYDRRKTIGELFSRIRHRILHGKTIVCVCGPGGTGKTTLGRFIGGALDTDKIVPGYQETIATEGFIADGAVPANFRVLPGQQARRASTWKSMYEDLASGRSFRVIHVVCWGLHATGLEKQRHRSYGKEMTDDEFRQAYFIDSRRMEIEALREILPHLEASPGELRMLTLVTKQDLWWNQRFSVEEFYRTGDYGNLIKRLRGSKGDANFKHEYLSCALVEQNLTMADGYSLAKTTEGYDDPLRLSNLQALSLAMEQFVGHE